MSLFSKQNWISEEKTLEINSVMIYRDVIFLAHREQLRGSLNIWGGLTVHFREERRHLVWAMLSQVMLTVAIPKVMQINPTKMSSQPWFFGPKKKSTGKHRPSCKGKGRMAAMTEDWMITYDTIHPKQISTGFLFRITKYTNMKCHRNLLFAAIIIDNLVSPLSFCRVLCNPAFGTITSRLPSWTQILNIPHIWGYTWTMLNIPEWSWM